MNCLKSISRGNAAMTPRCWRTTTPALHQECKLTSLCKAEPSHQMCSSYGVRPSSRKFTHITSLQRNIATEQVYDTSTDGCQRTYGALNVRNPLGSPFNSKTGNNMKDFHKLLGTSPVLDRTSEMHSRKYAMLSLAKIQHNFLQKLHTSSRSLGVMSSSRYELSSKKLFMPLSNEQQQQYTMHHLHTSSALAAASSSSELLSTSSAVPLVSSDHQQQQCNVHCGSASGMSGSRTPNFGDVFSEENKARVMTSLSRKTLRRFYTRDMKQRGAVLVPLCSVNQEPCVLFTLRSRMLKDHSGEVSFPGGKMDHTDKDVCHTAIREMEEELGIDQRTVEVWGNLPPIGRERISVVPVIGYLGELDVENIKFNTDEVSEVFVMTLSQLCSPESQAYTVYEPHEYSGLPIAALPVFVGGEHRVWGLTAIILDIALQSIVPDHYHSLIKKVQREVQRHQSAS